jgi:hypothetical protein
MKNIQSISKRKEYLRDPDANIAPEPFVGLDYVLCAVAFFLLGVAFVPEIASFIVRR